MIPQPWTFHPPSWRSHTATGHRSGSGSEVTQHKLSTLFVCPQTSMSASLYREPSLGSCHTLVDFDRRAISGRRPTVSGTPTVAGRGIETKRLSSIDPAPKRRQIPGSHWETRQHRVRRLQHPSPPHPPPPLPHGAGRRLPSIDSTRYAWRLSRRRILIKRRMRLDNLRSQRLAPGCGYSPATTTTAPKGAKPNTVHLRLNIHSSDGKSRADERSHRSATVTR